IYAWTVPLAFANSLFAPAASGLVSIYADPTEQGTILGAAQAFAALGRSFGPLVAGWAYDGLGQRTTFFLAGAVMLLGGVAGLRLRKAGGVALSRSSLSPSRLFSVSAYFFSPGPIRAWACVRQV